MEQSTQVPFSGNSVMACRISSRIGDHRRVRAQLRTQQESTGLARERSEKVNSAPETDRTPTDSLPPILCTLECPRDLAKLKPFNFHDIPVLEQS